MAASSLRKLDFAPHAKRVIFLYMNGGLSQVDSFDPKPALEKYHGQPLPGGSVATERKTGTLMKSPFEFKKYGKCGMEVSELFPHVGECADDICFIRSVYTDIPNHEPSMLMMNTGHSQVGRPSIGSWLTYGLGTENKNLPGLRGAVSGCSNHRRTAAVEQCVPAGRSPGHLHFGQSSGEADRSAGRQEVRSQESDFLHLQRQVQPAGAAPRAGFVGEAGSACGSSASRSRIRSSTPPSRAWKPRTACRRKRRRSSTSEKRATPR